jgi:hypothetical protein
MDDLASNTYPVEIRSKEGKENRECNKSPTRKSIFSGRAVKYPKYSFYSSYTSSLRRPLSAWYAGHLSFPTFSAGRAPRFRCGI